MGVPLPLGAARGTQAPGTSWLPRPRLISPHALVPVVKTKTPLWQHCGAQRTPTAWPVHRAHTVREGPTRSLGPWRSAWLCGGEWPPPEHKASAKTEEGEGRTFRQGTAPAKAPRPLAREMGCWDSAGQRQERRGLSSNPFLLSHPVPEFVHEAQICAGFSLPVTCDLYHSAITSNLQKVRNAQLITMRIDNVAESGCEGDLRLPNSQAPRIGNCASKVAVSFLVGKV